MRKIIAFFIATILLVSPGLLNAFLYVQPPSCTGEAEFSTFGKLYIMGGSIFLVHLIYEWSYKKLEVFFPKKSESES